MVSDAGNCIQCGLHPLEAELLLGGMCTSCAGSGAARLPIAACLELLVLHNLNPVTVGICKSCQLPYSCTIYR
jgi:hypothetical protein